MEESSSISEELTEEIAPNKISREDSSEETAKICDKDVIEEMYITTVQEVDLDKDKDESDKDNEGHQGQGQYGKTQDGEDVVEVPLQPLQPYWNYEIGQDFRPCPHLAVTPPVDIDLDKTKPPFNCRKKRLHFYKGCKWAPDGSCLISNSDDDILRLYNVPETLYGVTDWGTYQPEDKDRVQEIVSVLGIKEGGQVYDYCWYPKMSSWDPVTCCFLTTTADAPVHLWDAGYSGKLRASYLAYDHLDQVVAARSVAFDPTGQSIICGFDTLLRTFDITRPGRDCVERKLKHLQITELSQPGIVSCIAVNPSLTSVMAVGSYLKTVGLYHDDGSVLCILQGHGGGVTHLQFSLDGTKLFSGGRKDSRLICWDLRWMGEHYTIYDRVVETNQRIYFDITPNGKYLVTGGTDGQVRIWDVNSGDEPISSFKANDDCVNGVSINPFIPLLATSSGQRHIRKIINFSDDDDSDSESGKVPVVEERDIKLWKLC